MDASLGRLATGAGRSGASRRRSRGRRPRSATRPWNSADEDPVHQPILLARPRQHGPAPDRPGREPGRSRASSATSSAPRAAIRATARDVPSVETHNGVTIHRVGATAPRPAHDPAADDRLPQLLRPGRHRRGVMMPRHDVSVTLTTPPIIGLIGLILGRLKGTKHVFWSMDLHPDAGMALGFMSRKNPIVAALAWISDAVYRAADRVVVLGPYMADRIVAKRVRPDRVVTIHVWSRRDEMYPAASRGAPAAEVAGAGRQVRGHVLGQHGPGPLVRRVPGGGPSAQAPRRHGVPVRRRRPAQEGSARGQGEPRGWTTSASWTISRASNCTPRCRWPMCI